MELTRRSLLQLTATGILIPSPGADAEYRFHYEHIMGTSLDMVVVAPSEREANAAEAAALSEIARLCRILSTYDPTSEVSRLPHSSASRSPELAAVLAAYRTWHQRSGGAISATIGGALHVDALAKPFIAAKALDAARKAVPGVSGMILDAGGDVIVSGAPGRPREAWAIGVANPLSPFHNSPPLSILSIRGGAVATSGITARGTHIVDPRTGLTATSVLSATVLAADAMTANALSTAICVLGAEQGVRLVEQTPGAECLVVSRSGLQTRSSGFSRFERPVIVPAMAASSWPPGFEVAIELNLKGAGFRRPYVAVWIEDTSKHLIRHIVVFYQKPRYLNDLRAWFAIAANTQSWYANSRPTPAPGRYMLHWDGLDEKKNPVAQGTYRVMIETAREHSYYTNEFAQITCEEEPATAVSRKSPEYDPMLVTYGPKKQAV